MDSLYEEMNEMNNFYELFLMNVIDWRQIVFYVVGMIWSQGLYDIMFQRYEMIEESKKWRDYEAESIAGCLNE